MTPARRRNLDRLLKPRHVALIGGRDAAIVAGECERIGYRGPVWPVNPKRAEIGGHTCFARIEDLPEGPDAVFLAVPREAAVDAIGRLLSIGAGGVVCYSAGFGELGAGEGRDAEARLIAAAGDLAVMGPNCFGIINHVDRVALWPFAHGGDCPGYGAAIITQSGMLSSDIGMTQRSLPIAYMISGGNQAVLAIEDFIEALVDLPEVRAIGVHIEGLKSVPTFAAAALKALKAGKPIVALKTGASQVGARLTESHTGSLAGSDSLYDALFERLGVVRVYTPIQLLETVKMAVVTGCPKGRRLAAFTGSGGGAAMLADLAEKADLEFPAPAKARTALRERLPPIATVSNPLDYTTALFGLPEKLDPVLDAFFTDPYDVALTVQDYPLPGLDESKPFYRNDTMSFIAATRRAGVPAIVCSTFSECLDTETRDLLVANGVAPLQGLAETIDAIAGLVQVGERRAAGTDGLALEPPRLKGGSALTPLDEWQGKEMLAQAGIPIPKGQLADQPEVARAAGSIGFPVALKLIHRDLAHKTEAGAVALGLADARAVEAEAAAMLARAAAHKPGLDLAAPRFLVERMARRPIAELLVGIRNDPSFGLSMTLASGGILAELVGDAVTILLPADERMIGAALRRLRLSKLIGGYRGGAKADEGAIVSALGRLAGFALANSERIAEIEINPLLVLEDGVVAVDALVSVAAS
jgi:acyl-CoA synthetase (NDP forming)